MGGIGHDLRYGLRMLRKNPWATAIAAGTLALGIGANTAIFSAVNALLVRPLPFPEPERLVGVFNRFPELDRGPASLPDFEDWARQSGTIEKLSAVRTTDLNYLGRREPERLPGALISRDFLALHGLRPLAGRAFLPAEHREGAPAVALVGRELARRELGGAAAALGKAVSLNGKLYTVVGVMTSDWSHLLPWAETEVWLPLEADPPYRVRGTNYLGVAGRLRPGVTLRAARADMALVQQRLNAAFPGTRHDVVVLPLSEVLLGWLRPRLLVLLAAVVLVLLIACANVAGLVLIRAHGRLREFAIRAGLGARRGRMIRQVLTEGLLLAGLGGGAGVLLALVGIRLLLASWPANVSRPDTAGGPPLAADWRVLCFTLLAATASGLLCALAPALAASRADLAALGATLKSGAAGAGGAAARRGLRRFLVAGEIALATVLAVGAGLALRSLAALSGVELGFRPERLLTLMINLPAPKYAGEPQRSAFWEQLLGRLGALPGVVSTGTVANLPLGGGNTTGDFQIAGRPPWPAGQRPTVAKEIVSPGYFETMRIPLVRGRLFTARDRAAAPRVALINRQMAHRFWPGENPLGQRIDLGFGASGDWQEIVGIVADVRADGPETDPIGQVYVCALQYPTRSMSVVVRASGDPAALAPAARRQVYAVDPEQPAYRVVTMDTLLGNALSPRRMSARLLGLFAGLALLLAALGIYGATAYSVSQRTRELGLRIALGADRPAVVRLVLGEGTRTALIGLGLGLAAALVLTRLGTSLLYGVAATDPVTFAAVAAGFGGVALVASYLPARRATRVDPVVALRSE